MTKTIFRLLAVVLARRLSAGAALTALLFGIGAAPAQASVYTYSLPDIGTFNTYTNSNTSDTYSGTGFVGMYNASTNGTSAWVHLFGVEHTDFSRTVMQVDTSGLAGDSISSAILSFDLLDGGSGPHGVSLTGFDGGSGALAYSWDAPATNYGSVAGSVVQGANSLDVTALLQASLAAGDSWLGMHIQGTDNNYFMWTYTDPTQNYSPDRAMVRLTVTTVPEPATIALVGVGLLGLGFSRRRKRA